MRIGVLTAWLSRLNGGVFEAVVAHAALLREQGHQPIVFGLEDQHSAADRARFDGMEVITCPVAGPRRLGHAPGLLPALLDARLDIVHLHGIWAATGLAGARWARRTGRGYVVSPHGMLDPWITGRGRAQKAVARRLWERASWARASRLHALTTAEAGDIARETGRAMADIVVVPNPVAPPVADGAGPAGPPFVLALGRVHPKKNLVALVDGWAASRASAAGWQLTIAGWGEPAHVAQLEERLAVGDSPGARFIGPVYGLAKARLLHDAMLLALPSHSEGLPMAVLEAWAAGTPTLQSPGCNLPEGFAAGAAIETGTEPAAIAQAIDLALDLGPAGLATMGAAARGLAEGRFSPAAVQASWDRIYRKIGG